MMGRELDKLHVYVLMAQETMHSQSILQSFEEKGASHFSSGLVNEERQ
jgi:hypothetical protein